MQLSPRNRLIATIVAAVLIVILLIAGLIFPQVQKLGVLNDKVDKARVSANAAKLLLSQRQAFKDHAIDTNAKWLRLMNQVPDNPDLPSFIIELQDVAFKSGVQVLSVSPGEPSEQAEPTGTFWLIPVSVEVIGTWADTVDYLQLIMRLDRGVRLGSVNTKVIGSDGALETRNAALQPYALDTMITLETYLIPSGAATSTPAPASATQ